MRLGISRRPAITLIAATIAVSLTLSVVSASAPAATAGARTGAHHPRLGQTFRISTKPVKGGPDVVVGNAICLKNDGHVCAAMSPRDWVDVVTESIGAVGALIIIVKTISGSGKGKHTKKYKKDGTAGGGNQEGNGLCIGAWGYNHHVELGSCTSKHGIYWQLQSHNGGYRIWNTYSHGDLIAASTRNGGHLFIHSPEDWSTWKFEFCDGC